MVAVGGSIGTGLLLGTAAAIQLAGPAVILSFVLAAFISWTVALALGELASTHPAAGSFGVYGDLYLNSWAGFISRAGYWLAIAVSIGAEMVAATTYMQLWFPNVPAIVWVFAFSALLLAVNFLSVHNYGRFEFWFAMIKAAVIATFIVLGAALLLTGRAAPQYTTHGGFFPLGLAAPLLAITFAIYTFGGVEFVAVTSGESASAEAVARAVRWTFLTLAILYLGAITTLVGVMPWNRAGVTESPFVTVFRSVRIPGAAHLMNFVVLTAALSGANAALYISSRMLFSLARTGWAPRALFLWNRRRHCPRTLGPRSRLRIHHSRRLLRDASLLDHFASRPHQLPPALNRRPIRSNSRPLTLGKMGLNYRPNRRPRIRRQNLVGLPRQSNCRSNFPDRAHSSLLPVAPNVHQNKQ